MNETLARGLRAHWAHLLLIPVCLVWVYPFIWMVSASFKTRLEVITSGLSLIPEQLTFDNFSRAWTIGGFGGYTINTLLFAAGSALLTLAIAAPAGYALARPGLPGKKIIIGLLIANMFLPSGYTIIPLFILVDALGLNNTLVGVTLAHAAPIGAISILLFMGYFMGLPRDLDEAATMDGAGYTRTFANIKLPLAAPVIATVALFEFIGAWNTYFVPLVFTLGKPDLRTLGVGMQAFQGMDTSDYVGMAAGAAISVVPIIILFLFLQRMFIEGIAGAIKQ